MSVESQEEDTRLLITHLEFENFKSYFGKQTIGPFHKRFSSIIGPNGSGKSNVIDALLFVFGKKASKIRLKKVSELVHNSSNHPNCHQATVTVHFEVIKDVLDSDDDYQILEGRGFSVTRVATRSNKSQYFINRERVTLQQVKSKLSEHKIDLKNNRFLILQGEVESISLMKPKGANPNEEGLLEYLEDIIGTNQYVDQIAKAAEQEDMLGMEVQERLNRAKHVERERNKLKEAKTEAEEYIRKELDVFCKQGVLVQHEIFRGNNRVAADTKHKEVMEAKLEEEKSKSVGIRQELKDLENEYQELRSHRNVVIQELEAVEKQFQKREQEDAALAERLAYLKKEIKKAKTNKTKAEALIEKSESTIVKNEAQIPELGQQNVVLAKRLEQAQTEEEELMDSVQSRVKPFREAMEAKQKELLPLKDIENQAQQRLDVAVGQIRSLEQAHETGAQRLAEVQERIGVLQQETRDKSRHVKRVGDELTALQGRLAEAHGALNGFEREEKEMAGGVQACRGRYAAAQHAMDGQGAKHYIASTLLAEQERNRLSGIIGRLGDLGRIDDEYDVAVSTAGAGGLNCIVVEKTHHAQQAVQFLKKHKLGRATFIILEKQIESFQGRIGPIQTPNNAPRLFDLVVPHKEEYAVAFYYALRDTLVAENLEEGNTLAFGDSSGRRWRVATKRGQLIETSGTMSGGGGKPRSGLMSSRRRGDEMTPAQLQKIQEELQAMEQQFGQIREQKRNCMRECETLERQVNAKNVELRKLTLQMEGDRHRLEDLQSQLPELESASHMRPEDETAIRELTQDVKRLEKEKSKSTRNCASLNDQIEDLQQSILDAGGAELREKRKQVEGIQNQLSENEKTITRFRVEMETSGKKIATNRKKVETLEKELEQMHAEREEAQTAREQCLSKAVDLTHACEAKKNEEKEITKQWKKLEQIVKTKEKLVQDFQKLEMELEEKIKVLAATIRSVTKVVKAKQAELKKLSDKIKRNRQHLSDDGESDDEDLKDEIPPPAIDPNQPSPMDVDDEDDKEREEEKASEEQTATDPEPMNVDNDEEIENPSENSGQLVDKDGSIRRLSDAELEELDLDDVHAEITQLKDELKALNPNMSAIEAYRRKDDEYIQRLHDLTAVKAKRDENRQVYDDLNKTRLTEFTAGFNQITMKLKEMYRMLAQGGDAELELVDTIDPFAEGVQFSVRPPKKSWKNISNLSGGEKTLSSMALVFALHHCYPTPLYVMDEIDAALDFKNVSIVANYVKERTKNAQFIIISLRNNMFELGNRLVGIYKTHNVSKSITIDPYLFTIKDPSQSGTSTDDNSRGDEPLRVMSQNTSSQLFSPQKHVVDVGDAKDDEEDRENSLSGVEMDSLMEDDL